MSASAPKRRPCPLLALRVGVSVRTHFERRKLMGLFHRLQTLLAANFNDLLDQAENPEKLLRQAVRELETAQGRLLDAAARAIAHERLLARQHQACGERVNATQARAAAAARRGDDAA